MISPKVALRLSRLLVAYSASRLRQPKQFSPRVVLLSYPRSGSSWVGDVLSESPGSVYLREPVTQPYLRRYGARYTLVDPSQSSFDRFIYEALAHLAFDDSVIDLPERARKTASHNGEMDSANALIIKEVNPRAAAMYCSRKDTSVVLLLRHPAAVAHSFWRLGWLTAADTQLDPPGIENPDAWSRFGYAYGKIVADAQRLVANTPIGSTFYYEDLALDPRNAFEKLYEATRLPRPPGFTEVIDRYCFAGQVDSHRHETKRDSRATASKWAMELEPQAVRSIRAGYDLSPLDAYRADSDWTQANVESATVLT